MLLDPPTGLGKALNLFSIPSNAPCPCLHDALVSVMIRMDGGHVLVISLSSILRRVYMTIFWAKFASHR